MAEWVARQTAKQEVGSSNPSIPPLLKHACGEGDWLLCWQYTPAKGVTPEVNLRERILHMPPSSANKAEPTLALKPRGDVTRIPKQGYQWPHKWTCVQQKFFLKTKKHLRTRPFCDLNFSTLKDSYVALCIQSNINKSIINIDKFIKEFWCKSINLEQKQ